MWLNKKRKLDFDEEKIKENLQHLEKKDILAMFIAAFITFVPVILVILGAIFIILYYIFTH